MFNLPLMVIIPIIGFILQIYPRFFNKYFGVDVWTRLLETDLVRKNKNRIPDKLISDQFMVSGYFDYPPLFPLILSFISKSKLLEIQGFVAPFFDALHSIFIFLITFYLTGSQQVSIMAQFFYLVTPMIVLENSYLTPRSFGYLNFSLAVVPLLIYNFQGNIWFLYMGIFFSVLIFLTHRFATQSFLFLTIFFTFYLYNTLFLFAFFFGFISAILITRGYYLRVLKGHLFNIYFWIKNLDYRFAHQVRGVLNKDEKNDMVAKVYSIISLFSPIAIFGLNPWVLSGFLILLLSKLSILVIMPIQFAMVAWIIFFYVFGVAVLKFKFLMPIGEGQRYIEMATLPSVLLSAYLFNESLKSSYSNIVILATAISVFGLLALIIFVQIKGVINDRNRSITSDLQKVFDYINSRNEIPRILCIPHQNTTVTIYKTKAKVYVNADNPGLMNVTDVFPLIKYPIKIIAKKHNLTHMLLKESFASLNELHLNNANIEFKSGDVLYVKLS